MSERDASSDHELERQLAAHAPRSGLDEGAIQYEAGRQSERRRQRRQHYVSLGLLALLLAGGGLWAQRERHWRTALAAAQATPPTPQRPGALDATGDSPLLADAGPALPPTTSPSDDPLAELLRVSHPGRDPARLRGGSHWRDRAARQAGASPPARDAESRPPVLSSRPSAARLEQLLEQGI